MLAQHGRLRFIKDAPHSSLRSSARQSSRCVQGSTAQILRLACQANKLGVSGSSGVLLQRLLVAATKKDAKAKNKQKTSKPKKAAKPAVAKPAVAKPAVAKPAVAKGAKPKKCAPLFKSIKGGGERLSASAYYKQIAGGKLGNCEPQYIRQADGSMVLKKIKLCNDAWGSGQCVAKWVNA